MSDSKFFACLRILSAVIMLMLGICVALVAWIIRFNYEDSSPSEVKVATIAEYRSMELEELAAAVAAENEAGQYGTATAELARRYMFGSGGVIADEDYASELIDKCLEYYDGNAYATAAYGWKYYFGKCGESKDINKAYEYLKRADELGHPTLELSDIYSNSAYEVVEQDYDKALDICARALDGSISSDSDKSELYYSCGNIEYNRENYDKAIEYYQAAADIGKADAWYQLGNIYYFKLENNEKAYECCQKAIESSTQFMPSSYQICAYVLEKDDNSNKLEVLDNMRNVDDSYNLYDIAGNYYNGVYGISDYFAAYTYTLAALNKYGDEKNNDLLLKGRIEYVLGILFCNGNRYMPQDLNKASKYIQNSVQDFYDVYYGSSYSADNKNSALWYIEDINDNADVLSIEEKYLNMLTQVLNDAGNN